MAPRHRFALRLSPLLALAPALVSCAASQGDVCQQAIDVIEECTGVAPEYPAEGCVPEFAAVAEQVVAQGCDALGEGGKSDLLCTLGNIFGLCNKISLADAAHIATVDDVCGGRTDPLCAALQAGDPLAARDAAFAAVSDARQAALEDPAVRLYARERIVSLVVWNRLTSDGGKAAPSRYRAAAEDALAEHYPAYDPEAFVLARTALPPLDGRGCSGDHVIGYFPGVVRPASLEDYKDQAAAIERVLPCVRFERIDTGNFIHPEVNAEVAAAQLAGLGPDAKVHLIGYSQGSTNALRTLVDIPAIAEKTVSMLALNSAAHGSPVGDAFFRAAQNTDQTCEQMLEFARPTCESAGGGALGLIDRIAASMAIPLDTQHNLAGHLGGIRSLTTTEAKEFWDQRGAELPRHVLYTAFRSVISDTNDNLPASNRLFYNMVERAGGENPHNDMQVRLPHQTLGGPIADLEIGLPIAEGNHWQWVLVPPRDVTEQQMPADMARRAPQTALAVAYFETLFELGIVD